MKTWFAIAAVAALGFAAPAVAESWTLDGDKSHLAFGSIKSNSFGEVHSFGELSGTVAADGKAEILIDLASVETNIDIRNERLTEHVFKGIATANLSAAIDMSEVDTLAVGASTTTYADVTLSLLGTELSVDADLFVMRLSEKQVMVTTNDMAFFSTEDAGIDAGIDTLKELANLESITRAVPVTARFIFDLDDQGA